MKIEGVPEGWELVRIGAPKKGDLYVGSGGDVASCPCDYHAECYALVRKIEKPKRYRPFASAEEFKPHRDRWIDAVDKKGC